MRRETAGPKELASGQDNGEGCSGRKRPAQTSVEVGQTLHGGWCVDRPDDGRVAVSCARRGVLSRGEKEALRRRREDGDGPGRGTDTDTDTGNLNFHRTRRWLARSVRTRECVVRQSVLAITGLFARAKQARPAWWVLVPQ